MKVAFTIWRGRISPVFDVSREVLLIEIQDHKIVMEHKEALNNGDPALKLNQLVQLGVETLVCGAVSGPVADMAAASGIKMIPFVAGNIIQVKDAFLSGTLKKDNFFMPGCRRKRSRFSKGRQSRISNKQPTCEQRRPNGDYSFFDR